MALGHHRTVADDETNYIHVQYYKRIKLRRDNEAILYSDTRVQYRAQSPVNTHTLYC